MKKTTFEDLLKLAEILRSENGCPWDRKQTIASMVEHLDEEAKEVQQAIDKQDHKNLEEELGDLLFQIIMIAQIAKEEGKFDIHDSLARIEHKIRSRHTWVFGEDKATTPEEALALWQRNKAQEKK